MNGVKPSNKLIVRVYLQTCGRVYMCIDNALYCQPKSRMCLLLSALIALWIIPSAMAEPATKAQRADVLTWARAFFADPYSLRSTAISDQVLIPNYFGKELPAVCVEFNAKNLDGAYTGVQRRAFLLQGARLHVGETTGGSFTNSSCYAPQVTMKPFPELAKIQ